MKRVFTDKEGINPDYESSRPEWGDGFRAPSSLGSEYTETRTHVDMSDDTDISKLIIEGGAARTMTSVEILAIAQAEAIAEFKAARPAVIQAIQVNVDGMVFDGDEQSQTRMARAILAMDDLETTTWVLADNTPTTVTRAQLKAALRLSGEAQTAAWVFS